MTITMTVESPEEAAKIVAIAEAMRHQEQGPPIPVGRIGFARPFAKEPWAEEAEVVPVEFARECAGDGE